MAKNTAARSATHLFIEAPAAYSQTGMRHDAVVRDTPRAPTTPPTTPPPRRRRIKLSHLDSPYLQQINPSADDVHERTIMWAKAMGIVRTEQHVERLRSSLIGHLVARVFPESTDLTALQLAVDWTTLFCCLDDRLEQIHGAVLSAAYLRGLLRVFRDGETPRLIDPIANGFRDLRERMLELRVPNWIPRFSARIERLFNAFIDEAKFRTMNVVPEFASHRKIRQITVGLYTGFILGELTDGITLPPEVLEHEAVQALEKAASNIVGLANDIFTVERERAKGEVNNMVLVLMEHDNLSFEDALMRTIQLHDSEVREFRGLLSQVPSFDPEIDQQLRRYVDVLSAFISGHSDWAAHTSRYVATRAEVAEDEDEVAR
jgi:avermitilol synthase